MNELTSEPTSEPSRQPELIEDVARIFRANGFHGTTMSVVSERTGLGRSSIYHHFGRGKLEMAQRSLDVVETFIAAIEVTTQAPDASPQAKWRTIEAMLRKYYEDGQLGCLLAVFSLEDVPDALRERTKGLFNRWLAAMVTLYGRAGRENAPGEGFALRAVMMIQGGLVLSRAQSSEAAFEKALSEIASTLANPSRSPI